jgi:hypothetical protein
VLFNFHAIVIYERQSALKTNWPNNKVFAWLVLISNVMEKNFGDTLLE